MMPTRFISQPQFSAETIKHNLYRKLPAINGGMKLTKVSHRVWSRMKYRNHFSFLKIILNWGHRILLRPRQRKWFYNVVLYLFSFKTFVYFFHFPLTGIWEMVSVQGWGHRKENTSLLIFTLTVGPDNNVLIT